MKNIKIMKIIRDASSLQNHTPLIRIKSVYDDSLMVGQELWLGSGQEPRDGCSALSLP